MKRNSNLEDFVKANRDAFDFREPSPEVWEKIAAKNRKPVLVLKRRFWVRAAAVFALLVVCSAVLWQSNFLNGGYTVATTDPELKELMETEAFYARQVNSKLIEIEKCYHTFPELKVEIETDLDELEEMYDVLKTDLRENISNKVVIEAMIENNRYRLKLVDTVLEQINC